MTTADVRRPRGAATKTRILEAADFLFYDQGIRSVSIEDIIERANTTRMTLYRHYSSKDDLAVAYLRGRADRERSWMSTLDERAARERRSALLVMAADIAREVASEDFRGCAFLNAAGEFRDIDHPVRRRVAEHRAWYRGAVREMVGAAGVVDPDLVVDRIMLLRDGAMVGGFFGDTAARLGALQTAVAAIAGVRR